MGTCLHVNSLAGILLPICRLSYVTVLVLDVLLNCIRFRRVCDLTEKQLLHLVKKNKYYLKNIFEGKVLVYAIVILQFVSEYIFINSVWIKFAVIHDVLASQLEALVT